MTLTRIVARRLQAHRCFLGRARVSPLTLTNELDTQLSAALADNNFSNDGELVVRRNGHLKRPV